MIKILDSTLREGEQTPGVYFDIHIKAAIADMLDDVGIDIIETGHPAVTPEIRRSVQEIAHKGLNAAIGAHARSLEKDVDLALECGINFLGVFYCVSDERLNHHATPLNRAVDKISAVIRYAREKNPSLTIRYTPEDTVRTQWENVVTASTAAVRAGADIISIADTTGYMIPGAPWNTRTNTDRNMYDYVKRLKDELASKDLCPEIAVHCHNDRGLALANALDAYRAGVDIIDVTVLSIGERAGLVDLATLLAVLTSDFDEGGRWNMNRIPELYQLVSQYAGIAVPVNFPITGKNAFTHCAGVHTQAAIKDPLHYQSIEPEMVGRGPEISLDHMSGIAAVKYCMEAIGENECTGDTDFVANILAKVKEVGQTGRVVDLTELGYIVRHSKKSLRRPGALFEKTAPGPHKNFCLGEHHENRFLTLADQKR